MLSHVKSGAIYHNYSISPNISSSFFDFSSLSLSFWCIMPQFCCIALSPMSISLQLCRPARVLPRRSWLMRIGRHSHRYRPMSMRVSAGVNVSTVRCAWLSLVSNPAGGHGGPSEGGWRSGRVVAPTGQGGKRLSVMDIGGWASRLCYLVSVPWARLSIVYGAIETISDVLIYIKNTIIL